MSFAGLIIELLVAALLAITIGYCAILNQRLKKMRADEATMRAVITELVRSTETAERAILGLRATASECNKTISARINEAKQINANLEANIAQGRHAVSQSNLGFGENPNSAAFQRNSMLEHAISQDSIAPEDKSLARQIAEEMLAAEMAELDTPMQVPAADNQQFASAQASQNIDGYAELHFDNIPVHAPIDDILSGDLDEIERRNRIGAAA